MRSAAATTIEAADDEEDDIVACVMIKSVFLKERPLQEIDERSRSYSCTSRNPVSGAK
jgi:hypothetical protein